MFDLKQVEFRCLDEIIFNLFYFLYYSRHLHFIFSNIFKKQVNKYFFKNSFIITFLIFGMVSRKAWPLIYFCNIFKN